MKKILNYGVSFTATIICIKNIVNTNQPFWEVIMWLILLILNSGILINNIVKSIKPKEKNATDEYQV